MIRKFMTLVAATAFALVTLAPVEASAQRRHRGDWGGDYAGCRDDNNYGCERDRDRREDRNGYGGGYGYGDDHRYRRHDDNDDEIAAGVIGLVLGVVVGSAIANSNNGRDDRHDDRYDNSGYNDDRGYSDQRYAPPPQQQCTRRERQWDRYANRYVMVDVPC